MRARALDGRAARRAAGSKSLDAGAGTGFTTEGIVERVDPARVTMLDQSPHQLARARRKPALARLPRSCSATPRRCRSRTTRSTATCRPGSIEYWPDPQRGIAEAYRVLRAGGTATLIGPVEPANRARCGGSPSRGCCSRPRPTTAPGSSAPASTDVEVARAGARLVPRPLASYAVAVTRRQAGRGPVAGSRSARAPRTRAAPLDARRPRCASPPASSLGSAAGLAFVPIGAALALRARLAAPLMAGRGRRRRARARRRRCCGASRGRTRSSGPPSASPACSRSRSTRSASVDAGRAAFHLFWTLVAGPGGQRLHRRHQPDHRRRDRPRQQAGLPIAAGDLSVERGVVDRRRVRRAAGRARAHAGRAGARRRGRRAGDRRRPTRSPPAAPEALPDRRLAVRLRRALGDRQPRRGRALHSALGGEAAIPPRRVGADARSCSRSASRSRSSRTSPTRRATARTGSRTFTVRHGGRAVLHARPGGRSRSPTSGWRARPAAASTAPTRRCSRPATWPRSPRCWAAARSADPADHAEFTRFYMRVWLLFFLEYAHRSRFLFGRIGRSYGHRSACRV